MTLTLKSLLCRHDFYWSERHQSNRCRRCGLCEGDAPIRSVRKRHASARQPIAATAMTRDGSLLLSRDQGQTVPATIRGLFCHHQWDISRSRPGTYVCHRCGSRKA